MNCYKSLVTSQFLANARSEMIDARARIVSEVAIDPANNTFVFDRNERQEVYYVVGNMYGFFNELYNLQIEDNRIYYLTYDCYMLIISRKKALMDSAVMAAHNVNGDIPYFRTKHKFNGKLVHSVLFNTNFTIPPVTLN